MCVCTQRRSACEQQHSDMMRVQALAPDSTTLKNRISSAMDFEVELKLLLHEHEQSLHACTQHLHTHTNTQH